MYKTDILFTGYYGQLNTGDDAFAVVSDWAARKYWKQQNIKFFGDKLPRRLDESELKSSFLFNKKFKGKNVIEMTTAGFLNQKIIYAGGSVFHTAVKGLTKNAILQKHKKLGVTELGAIGVSLGPFRTQEDYNSIRDYLNKFSFLGLRDRRSYEVAQEMNLNIPFVDAFDLAALLPKIYPINKNENKNPIIGVSICNYESYTNGDKANEKRRFNKIVETLKVLLTQIPNIKIKVFIFNAHPKVGDLQISKDLISQLPNNCDTELIEYNQNTFLMWNAVSSCDAVLATRLHAGIFSYFSKTPFLQVEYHRKCNDFLKAADYPLKYQIGDIETAPKEVSEKLIDLLSESNANLFSNTVALQEKALLNFTEFKKQFN